MKKDRGKGIDREESAKIGKYINENGNNRAARHFSKLLDQKIADSAAKGLKAEHLQASDKNKMTLATVMAAVSPQDITLCTKLSSHGGHTLQYWDEYRCLLMKLATKIGADIHRVHMFMECFNLHVRFKKGKGFMGN